MIFKESSEAYRARSAVSAGFLWNIVNECPAYAWARCDMNPKKIAERAEALDFGTAAHLAVLEPDELENQVVIVRADSWRSAAARNARDLAYEQRRVPLLEAQLSEIMSIRKAIMDSAASDWFANGAYEQTIVVEEMLGSLDVSFKGRADCVALGEGPEGPIVDLKTSVTASPEAFQRACERDGHHLRAAWYTDIWIASERELRPYIFVVVAKSKPPLVECYELDENAVDRGRQLYRRALEEVRIGLETGVWRGYNAEGEKITKIGLRPFTERKLAEMFAEEDWL